MRIADYLRNALSLSASDDANFVEVLYGIRLDGEIKKITDSLDESISFESEDYLRLLSKEEITDAEKDMQVDFVENGIIPIFDTGDNDYISYDVKKSKWCRYNIVDEISFSEKNTIEEYFK